mmetsp:Transcript_47376/g.141391  ORF Transcript_47376/g.141391 Transcript_47376/m.141391 type:complete len:415 (+) Transcript_47376:739-1983(+)
MTRWWEPALSAVPCSPITTTSPEDLWRGRSLRVQATPLRVGDKQGGVVGLTLSWRPESPEGLYLDVGRGIHKVLVRSLVVGVTLPECLVLGQRWSCAQVGRGMVDRQWRRQCWCWSQCWSWCWCRAPWQRTRGMRPPAPLRKRDDQRGVVWLALHLGFELPQHLPLHLRRRVREVVEGLFIEWVALPERLHFRLEHDRILRSANRHRCCAARRRHVDLRLHWPGWSRHRGRPEVRRGTLRQGHLAALFGERDDQRRVVTLALGFRLERSQDRALYVLGRVHQVVVGIPIEWVLLPEGFYLCLQHGSLLVKLGHAPTLRLQGRPVEKLCAQRPHEGYDQGRVVRLSLAGRPELLQRPGHHRGRRGGEVVLGALVAGVSLDELLNILRRRCNRLAVNRGSRKHCRTNLSGTQQNCT